MLVYCGHNKTLHMLITVMSERQTYEDECSVKILLLISSRDLVIYALVMELYAWHHRCCHCDELLILLETCWLTASSSTSVFAALSVTLDWWHSRLITTLLCVFLSVWIITFLFWLSPIFAARYCCHLLARSLLLLPHQTKPAMSSNCLEVRGEIIRTVSCCIVYCSCAQAHLDEL